MLFAKEFYKLTEALLKSEKDTNDMSPSGAIVVNSSLPSLSDAKAYIENPIPHNPDLPQTKEALNKAVSDLNAIYEAAKSGKKLEDPNKEIFPLSIAINPVRGVA